MARAGSKVNELSFHHFHHIYLDQKAAHNLTSFLLPINSILDDRAQSNLQGEISC